MLDTPCDSSALGLVTTEDFLCLCRVISHGGELMGFYQLLVLLFFVCITLFTITNRNEDLLGSEATPFIYDLPVVRLCTKP